MRPTGRLFICLIAAMFIASVEPFTQSGVLRVERSPMKLRASGATYEGLAHRSMTPDKLAALRARDYWREARSGDAIFFAAHLTYTSEGLGVWQAGEDEWKSYPMFALAIAAGWYTALPGENGFPDAIRGVAFAAGRVWMGTAGLGIVARDLRAGTWSRYDVKAGILPGIHSEVFHADDEHLFAYAVGPSGDWQERLPGVRASDLGPALEVYSFRRDAWLRVRAIPRENVSAFGWTTSPRVSMGCDTRPYAARTEMPIAMCTSPSHVTPAPDGSAYVLSREFDSPGAPLRYTIRKDQLDAAYGSLR